MATLAIENLAKSYNGRQVVKTVNIQVSSGEVIGLLGPNGAGKRLPFIWSSGWSSRMQAR